MTPAHSLLFVSFFNQGIVHRALHIVKSMSSKTHKCVTFGKLFAAQSSFSVLTALELVKTDLLCGNSHFEKPRTRKEAFLQVNPRWVADLSIQQTACRHPPFLSRYLSAFPPQSLYVVVSSFLEQRMNDL